MEDRKKAVVIGAGFAGLSAASYLAKDGFDVVILEKNNQAGGRAGKLQRNGFAFDMGPSWYWMPDVFERYFAHFDKKICDYYKLHRLSPSYRVFFGKNDIVDVPADISAFYELFEQIEPGSSQKLRQFLHEAAYKYDIGINDLVYKPGLSILEYLDKRVISGILKLHLFQNFHSYIRKYFSNPKLLQLLEFPILFLGAQPKDIPALYSLMNYADIALGTWYPEGGIHKVVEGMVALAQELGVFLRLNEEVIQVITSGTRIISVKTSLGVYNADVVIGGADYHHIETKILQSHHKSYSSKYWEKRALAPSSLIYYIGTNKKISNLLHHNLFFDTSFEQHAKEIYESPSWPTSPLFYVSVTSKTDNTVAPEGCENLFILIPVSPGLKDTKAIRDQFFNIVIHRLEDLTGENLREHIIFRKDYAHNDFVNDYHAFKGNAYGLANTIKQTAFLKPSIKSKKISNLYYTGQLTVPGPGVPPSLISGKVVANEIIKKYHRKHGEQGII